MEVDGKAEIVNGRSSMHYLVNWRMNRLTPAALRIAASLDFCTPTQHGGRAVQAFGDNVGFLCNLPNRKSFSPDAAFYVGPPNRKPI